MAAVVLVGGLAAPVMAQGGTGFVEVCKTAAEDSPGLVGDGFTFTVEDADDAEPRGTAAVPASAYADRWVNCTGPIEVAPGEVTITEDLVAGTQVSAIDVRNTETWVPDPENRSVVVDVAAGTDVIVLFENQAVDEGVLEICKRLAEDEYSQSLAGAVFPFTVTIGEGAPAEYSVESDVTTDPDYVPCTAPIEVPAGTEITVVEGEAEGYTTTVTDIEFRNAATSDASLETRTATLTVAAATDALVVFTNTGVQPQPDNGILKVCKALAEGATSTATFDFLVDGVDEFGLMPTWDEQTESWVPACTANLDVEAGEHTVQELAEAGWTLQSVVSRTFPGDVSETLTPTDGEVTVDVGGGETVVVTFTNAPVPPQPDNGILKVCKALAESATSTATFDFLVDGVDELGLTPTWDEQSGSWVPACTANLDVEAGEHTVQELAEAGWTLQSVVSRTFPGDVSETLTPTDGEVTVDVGGGETVVVTFTNAPVPPQPDNGCTLTQGFWKNHPEAVADALENGNVTLDGTTPLTAEEIEEILTTSGGSDYWYKLAHQLIAAQLNLLASDGGTAPEEVADAIAAAQHFFATDADGADKPSETVTHDGQTYTLSELNSILTAFNEGTYEGWPHCDSQ